MLDEPTSEVDYTASRKFWNAFRARGKSSALVIATHDVELALSSSVAILLLNKGQPAHLASVAAFTLGELSAEIGEG